MSIIPFNGAPLTVRSGTSNTDICNLLVLLCTSHLDGREISCPFSTLKDLFFSSTRAPCAGDLTRNYVCANRGENAHPDRFFHESPAWDDTGPLCGAPFSPTACRADVGSSALLWAAGNLSIRALFRSRTYLRKRTLIHHFTHHHGFVGIDRVDSLEDVFRGSLLRRRPANPLF